MARLSPLRYPGGKSRAVAVIAEKYIIPNLSTNQKICSPFFGGGSIELYLADVKKKEVIGYDGFGPLVDFWKVLKKNPKGLARHVAKYNKLGKTERAKQSFPGLKKEFRKKSKQYSQVKRAAVFYVLNRTSYSGTTLSGGMAIDLEGKHWYKKINPRFNTDSIRRLEKFSVENFTVNKMDFRKSIPKNKDALIYADPPYFIEKKGLFYGDNGDKSFAREDHEDLAKILNGIKNKKWILSYNNDEYIKNLYPKRRIEEVRWSYGMSDVKSRKKKHSSEILILSDKIKIQT